MPIAALARSGTSTRILPFPAGILAASTNSKQPILAGHSCDGAAVKVRRCRQGLLTERWTRATADGARHPGPRLCWAALVSAPDLAPPSVAAPGEEKRDEQASESLDTPPVRS